jgi:predicted MFS family arabinose efflux permease
MTDSATRVGGTGLLALVATYGLGRQALGLFFPALQDSFGLSLDTLGFIAGAAQAGYLAMVVVAGLAAARWGPQAPVVAGCAAFATGAVLVTIAPGTAVLAAGLILAGASAGGTWAPFSDAVSQQVPPGRRPRALALVNAGSPVGLAVASAGVLLAGGRWRLAWVGFAVVGVVAALLSQRVLAPTAPPRSSENATQSTWRWFLTPRSGRLYVSALMAALASAAYFTFAPDAVSAAGQPGWVGPAMWAAMGLVGAALGIVAGDIAKRYGLWLPLVASWLTIAAALGLLAWAPGSPVLALISAGLFGSGFTVGYAQIALWSQEVFATHPTSGFTATIMFTALGFTVAPAVLGTVAVAAGRSTALLVAAVPAVVAAATPPTAEDRQWS